MRRIWIITRTSMITDSDRADALLNGCPEIVNGIPPALKSIISEDQLPYAYEEPQTQGEPPRSSHVSILEAIDITKARLARIKRVWEGREYFYDCLVTQSVKDEYQTGKIVIGDHVLVHFDDIGEQVITSKVFKSW